jgi:hypothetical protein
MAPCSQAFRSLLVGTVALISWLGTPAVTGTSTQTPPGVIIYESPGTSTNQAFRLTPESGASVSFTLPLIQQTGAGGISLDGTHVAVALAGQAGTNRESALETTPMSGRGSRIVWRFKGTPAGAPAWNPAGTELALTITSSVDPGGAVFPGDLAPGLWVISAKGGRAKRLAAGAVGDVAWSPGGKSIVYSTDPNQFPVNVEVVGTSSGRSSRLLSLPGYGLTSAQYVDLAWAPSASVLVDSYGGPLNDG